MVDVRDNRAIASNCAKWAKIRWVWLLLGEYVADYLSGQKHKVSLKQNNQKQK